MQLAAVHADPDAAADVKVPAHRHDGVILRGKLRRGLESRGTVAVAAYLAPELGAVGELHLDERAAAPLYGLLPRDDKDAVIPVIPHLGVGHEVDIRVPEGLLPVEQHRRRVYDGLHLLRIGRDAVAGGLRLRGQLARLDRIELADIFRLTCRPLFERRFKSADLVRRVKGLHGSGLRRGVDISHQQRSGADQKDQRRCGRYEYKRFFHQS